MNRRIRSSVVSGVISLVIGVGITYGAWRFTTPPRWDLIGVLFAVALASFFSGFGGAYGAEVEE